MATHRAVALLDKPGATRTSRPAAELIAQFGVELPSVPTDRPRHSTAVPSPRVDSDRAAHPLISAPVIPAQPSGRPDWFATGWSAPALEPADAPEAPEADRTSDEVRARVAALLAEFPSTDDAELAGGALFDAHDRIPLAAVPPAEDPAPAASDDEADDEADDSGAPTAADLHAIATDRTGARRVSSAPAGLAGATAAFAVEQARRTRLGGIPHQGAVAAASATVLGATAAIVAATGGFTAHDTAADLSATVDQATQRIELAKPADAVPQVQLNGASDTVAKKVAEAADKHRADATQIIAAARAPQRTGNAGGAGGANAGGGDTGGAGTVVAGSSKGAAALRAALTQQGKPYVWGAAGPSAYDCSGLVLWAFKQVGVSLPHSSSAQSRMGTAVSKADLQPGDLVFFYSPVSHVGIYMGNGNILHASTSGQPVKISKMAGMPFNSARRL